ncbi:MAG TPA: phosphoenolpyruvate synthase [Acidimicrobiales bacterium]
MAEQMADQYVLGLREVDANQVDVVGGKGANLGELMRLATASRGDDGADGEGHGRPGRGEGAGPCDGVGTFAPEPLRVPDGFCVTTAAFRRATAGAPALAAGIDRLAGLDPDDADGRQAIRTESAAIREAIAALAVPDDVAAAITGAVAALGEHDAYAVRSSATAEDQPAASFAGQQHTYLDVVGPDAVLHHVVRCWASLFTERAVAYRQRQGIDHRRVAMGVVVQRMVPAEAAGVLFTADPVTGHRRVAQIEAVFGLGEALVSGRAKADELTVRDGAVVDRAVAGERPALTDAQAVRLVALGRRIEAHFGRPQDVEWCRVGDDLHVVQSRPITTLFPVPKADDGETHVYVSVGHQQMMTDPLKPLGISVWQLTAGRPMHEAGGRLFVDVTRELASPVIRPGLLRGMAKSDPLIGDALQSLVDRGDVLPPADEAAAGEPAAGGGAGGSGGAGAPPKPPAGAGAPPAPLETDPAIVTGMIDEIRASVAAAADALRGKTGPELLDAILADAEEMKALLFGPRNHQVLMAGFEAAWWLDDHLGEWLGEKGAADTLIRSVPHDVTAEMGLALLDVADAIRPHPEAVAVLERVERKGRVGRAGRPGRADEAHDAHDAPDADPLAPPAGGPDDAHPAAGPSFLDELDRVEGGPVARAALEAWLDAYGVRGPGEIDITRPRWRERPDLLVPALLGHVRNAGPGERARREAEGRRAAARTEAELLERLRTLPDGEQKAAETKRMIDRVRTFIGYREYPKFGIVSRYFVYKRALLEEAERLVRAGVLRRVDDVFYLTVPELQEVVRTRELDPELVRRRRAEHRAHAALTPPRVLTSDGEAVAGSYRRDGLPPGALAGLAVSAGTVEGRARVVRAMAEADVEPGDILVTAHADPSWTPLFVAAAGLVTEVGGSMTHGAVVAREYGLPAVVGVEDATRLIADGQRIRVHGTDGFVELLV